MFSCDDDLAFATRGKLRKWSGNGTVMMFKVWEYSDIVVLWAYLVLVPFSCQLFLLGILLAHQFIPYSKL